MNETMVTIGLTLENVDVVLNALEEKALNVQKLRTDIYNNVSAQVETLKREKEIFENENIKGKRKKGNK